MPKANIFFNKTIKYFRNNLLTYRRLVYCFFLVNFEYLLFIKSYLLGARCVCIAIDDSCSPPTYGDSVFSAMLARYCQKLGMHVYFYIIEGDYRSDWNDLGSSERVDYFIAERYKLISCILGSNDIDLKIVDWGMFINMLSKKSSSLIVPFERKIRKRLGVYYYYGRLLNMLFNRQIPSSKGGFLLTASDFPEDNNMQPLFNKPFVSIGCRYSNYWAPERNLSDSEFVTIVSKLSLKWPNRRLMILSCPEGCAHFRAIAKKHSFDVLFSKDYSSSLLGDVNILLRSEFFFILKGGGISIFAQCSAVPFECYQPADKAIPFRPHSFFSWNHSRQVYCNTDMLPKSFFDSL